MELSVEVIRQDGRTVYFCRGSLVQGLASDYLFHLLTRSCTDNIVIDLADVSDFDAVGLQALGLVRGFLNTCQCGVAVQHAPPILMEHFRQTCDHHQEI